jgi:hypothetical protein
MAVGAGRRRHAGDCRRAERWAPGKLKSNLEEVRARGGELYLFADARAGVEATDDVHFSELSDVGGKSNTYRLHYPVAIAGVSRRGAQGY